MALTVKRGKSHRNRAFVGVYRWDAPRLKSEGGDLAGLGPDPCQISGLTA